VPSSRLANPLAAARIAAREPAVGWSERRCQLNRGSAERLRYGTVSLGIRGELFGQEAIPCSSAYRVSSAVVCTPSFSMMLVLWNCAVVTEMCR